MSKSKFSNQLVINAPAAEVFAFISDFQNIPKWNYYVMSVTQVEGDSITVGARYHQIRKNDEQYYEIIALTPDASITVQTSAGLPRFTRKMTVKPHENGTHLLDEWIFDFGWIPFANLFISKRVKSAVGANLQKLKTLLETSKVTLQDGRTIRL